MSRRAKIACGLAAGLLGLIVTLLAALFIVPNTDAGRAYIERKVGELTEDRVRIAGIHGSFPAALRLDRLELRDRDGLWLWAEQLAIHWSPGALLGRHVEIDSVQMALLHVERTPLTDPDDKPSPSSSVPDTDVRDLSIQTLELGKALAGEPASLTVKANVHLRSLEDANGHLTARRVNGTGDYELEAQLDPGAINATLRAQEPAHGPLASLIKVPDIGAIRVDASIKGPRHAEALQLTVDAGPLRAHATGQVDLKDAAADLQYSLTAPAMSPSEGLRWKQIDLQGQLHGPFSHLAAEGHLQLSGLEAPGGIRVASVDAQIHGDQGALRLLAGIDGLQIPGPAPKLLQDSRLSVDAALRLDDPQRPLALAVNHRLFALDAKAVTAGHARADLTLRVPDLKPFTPLSGMPVRGDAQLAAQVDYTPELTQLTADLSARLDAGRAAWAGLVRGGVTRARLTAKLTDQQLAIEQLNITGAGLALTADGKAGRTGDQPLKARFDLTLPSLRRVTAGLEGDLKVAGSIEGPRARLSADTRISTNLSVNGSPKATLSARLQAKGLPQSPQGVFAAEGQLDGAPVQVNVEVEPEKAGQFRAIIHRADWKSASAQGDVTFGGAGDARGSAQLLLGDLADFDRLAGAELKGTVRGRVVLAAQAGRPSAQLDLEATDVVAGGITGNAKISAHGPLEAVSIQLEADSPAIAARAARLNAAAVLNVTAREVQLTGLQATYHEQDLKLLSPAKIQFAQGLSVQQLKLGVQDASLEVDGQVSPTLDLRASVRNVQPALVNAFAPDLLATGAADADADLHGTTAAPEGTVHVQALNIRAKNSQAQGLPATDLRASATLKGGRADVEAHLTAGSGSKVALTGSAPLTADGNLDLRLLGDLNLALANPLLEADGRHVAGTLAIDTTVKGSSSAPDIEGTIRLSNGSVRDYAQGLSLTDIAGEFVGSEGVLRIQRLTARAAPGSVSIDGTVGVAQPLMPVNINLTAKNAQPIASQIVTANLDAGLHLSGNARESLMLDGKIHLNRADITIPGGLPPDVAVLDVEREGVAPPSPASRPLVTRLNIEMNAPNRILIKGRGLDAEMGGELHVRGTTASPRVEGAFELQRGFFTLANSKLQFTSGSVTFNGTGLQEKIDPSLDFTAQSKAAEVTAIVHITGVADAPQLELSSSPELPQDEILARLLFGQPAAQLSALELVETGAALASLRGGGNGPSLNPLNRIQKALGLDRLSVSSASNSSSASSSDQKSGTSVEAGRYVSSRVYVGVKEGTTGASQVDVDVDLTKNLKLQAQLGNGSASAQGVTPENDPGSSLGLAYQFEY